MRWDPPAAPTCRDRLLPFGSLDPVTVRDRARAMGRIINELKLSALKLHPPHQLFYPNQYRDGLEALAVIYRMAEQARLPVMIHIKRRSTGAPCRFAKGPRRSECVILCVGVV